MAKAEGDQSHSHVSRMLAWLIRVSDHCRHTTLSNIILLCTQQPNFTSPRGNMIVLKGYTVTDRMQLTSKGCGWD